MSEKRESHHNFMMRKLIEMWSNEEENRRSLLGVNSRGESESLLNYEVPQLRAKIGELRAEVEALKADNAELTKCYYEVLRKIDNA